MVKTDYLMARLMVLAIASVGFMACSSMSSPFSPATQAVKEYSEKGTELRAKFKEISKSADRTGQDEIYREAEEAKEKMIKTAESSFLGTEIPTEVDEESNTGIRVISPFKVTEVKVSAGGGIKFEMIAEVEVVDEDRARGRSSKPHVAGVGADDFGFELKGTVFLNHKDGKDIIKVISSVGEMNYIYLERIEKVVIYALDSPKFDSIQKATEQMLDERDQEIQEKYK